MRAVIQRVLQATVEVEGRIIASIDTGLLVLIGIHSDDSHDDMKYIIGKIMGLRIFNDDRDIMNHSVQDIKGGVLLVPQFTLYGDARRGNRPSYSSAMPPTGAAPFFSDFLDHFRSAYPGVVAGLFGADMKVSLTNWGPVTILLDSSKIL